MSPPSLHEALQWQGDVFRVKLKHTIADKSPQPRALFYYALPGHTCSHLYLSNYMGSLGRNTLFPRHVAVCRMIPSA